MNAAHSADASRWRAAAALAWVGRGLRPQRLRRALEAVGIACRYNYLRALGNQARRDGEAYAAAGAVTTATLPENCPLTSLLYRLFYRSVHIDSPPSTGSTVPVMYPASAEARKATTADISLGSAKRLLGIAAVSSAFLSAVIDAIIRVAALGEIALTVTLNRASSLAAVLVKPMIPALAAA